MTTVFYKTIRTPVGEITVFADDKAITALEWGRPPASQSNDLVNRALDQLMEFFDGKRQTFDLPLAPQGTPFQKKVWAKMQKIGFGKTTSYQKIATALGSSPRAVGGACGKNPIPIFIPCHRVIGSSGGLGGYSGGEGIVTKDHLLKFEAQ